MALYALSDLHLSLGTDKPMDVFGSSWHNHTVRIFNNWSDVVSDDDLVVMGGDISWATYLSEAKVDFEFLNSLPGKKVIIKGNHDYWWESNKKLTEFIDAMNFTDICFLNNSAYLYENFSVSGTRFWTIPGSDSFSAEDNKIYKRELIRLRLSLDDALCKEAQNPRNSYIRIVVLHYPPFMDDGVLDWELRDILSEYNVSKCIYGHIHGGGIRNAFQGVKDGVEYILTSADSLDFTPVRITN